MRADSSDTVIKVSAHPKSPDDSAIRENNC